MFVKMNQSAPLCLQIWISKIPEGPLAGIDFIPPSPPQSLLSQQKHSYESTSYLNNFLSFPLILLHSIGPLIWQDLIFSHQKYEVMLLMLSLLSLLVDFLTQMEKYKFIHSDNSTIL